MANKYNQTVQEKWEWVQARRRDHATRDRPTDGDFIRMISTLNEAHFTWHIKTRPQWAHDRKLGAKKGKALVLYITLVLRWSECYGMLGLESPLDSRGYPIPDDRDEDILTIVRYPDKAIKFWKTLHSNKSCHAPDRKPAPEHPITFDEDAGKEGRSIQL